jgi:hypothetical protein
MVFAAGPGGHRAQGLRSGAGGAPPDGGHLAEDLRRGLLEEALEFHRRFLEESPDDPRIQMDWQPDGSVDLSDAIASLTFLFTGGPPHVLAVPDSETQACVPIVGCTGSARCP